MRARRVGARLMIAFQLESTFGAGCRPEVICMISLSEYPVGRSVKLQAMSPKIDRSRYERLTSRSLNDKR